MKHAIAAAALGLFAALAALAQSPDFARKPPAWQVALEASKEVAAGEAIATKGKGAALACAGCHGAKGVPAAGAPFPRLAGLPVEYFAKQLFDYRDGIRANAIMGPIGKALADAEIASLAWYYASLEVSAPRATASADQPQRGWQLARYGDNALALPACVDCHGGDVTGGGPVLPGLAQPAAYTAAQLSAFRDGERKNDGDGIMQAIAKRLSDADVKALADYYAER
ncbi:MAG TPA: c-type cytochrome [Burkholderiales bacterium]|nr:c-type cytochrome [Burkholderiales bacterium]